MSDTKRRASCVGGRDISTVVLIDRSQRPIMNLHKVPLSATIWAIKTKISERLKEVGRSLSADTMQLFVGEGSDRLEEMKNNEMLSTYNTLGLSRFTVIISRKTKVEILIALTRPEKKCLCITKQKKLQEEFPVVVSLGYNPLQFTRYVAETMNCGVTRTDVKLYQDEAMQDKFPEEGTLRSLNIADKTRLYAVMPPGFDINNIKYPTIEAEAKKVVVQEPETLTEEAPAQSVGEKSKQEKDFEARAKGGSMSQADAGAYARLLGFSPSLKEVAALPAKVGYKAFQEFLNVAMHPDDNQESFREFFNSFDTRASGDLTRKQVTNILQMWGDEPLNKAEAAAFCELVMGQQDNIPIKVLLDV
ncbi:putative myosin light chain 2 [Besnoitia besnoiti]|uniref:Putative myosin light chain 2 n=1 Tax=Besnoitia besnoiti TaxID=94643 RepID=A0A2A9MJ63_BESBE|nr:putative myosin light chain 2 [Besnoitia besnoiti]PFH35440.1 putative myosin light chain 2 [Besnoitia besnoiti]